MALCAGRTSYRWMLAGALMVLCAAAAGALDRPTLALDGTWQFRFAPDERGEAERWYASPAGFDRPVHVPGCWDAQGVGAPTDKVRHNAVGAGWYRRTFGLPAGWRGRRVWLVVGGAHRSAQVWLNGRRAGEHWGYPTAFRLDLTPCLAPGPEQHLVIAVDSRRHRERDTLTGAFDCIDFMDVDWGGLFGPVRLEATRGAWIEDAFVQPDPGLRLARADVTITDERLSAGARSLLPRGRRAGDEGESLGAGGRVSAGLHLARAPFSLEGEGPGMRVEAWKPAVVCRPGYTWRPLPSPWREKGRG